MTSDKFIYLFGRMIPALSLVFAMVLRFVPKFQAQFRVISQGQQCIGRDLSQGNLLTRARNGLTILSILTTWALENAIRQGGERIKDSVMASDAFFPFADCVEAAHKAGITAIIQPGGSIHDQDSIDAANKYNIAMIFTGMRHFKH